MNRQHSWRRFAPAANASRQSSSRDPSWSWNGIENLMGPLLMSVHHVSERLFTISPVHTAQRGEVAPSYGDGGVMGNALASYPPDTQLRALC